MTFDGANECFVYITLPDTTDPVPCGRFRQERTDAGKTVGKFVYGKRYLRLPDAVAVDPLQLPLTDRVHETAAANGIFGALRDSSPDYWGRLCIERRANRSTLSEIDYLLHSPDDRAGALGFGLNATPPAPLRQFNRTLDLARLQELADRLIAEGELPAEGDGLQAQRLLLMGTSMGGARPKAVVEDDGHLWLAKFNRQDDRWNMARVEHGMLLLARECGLQVADSRIAQIGDGDVLLVKRFDRQLAGTGYRRARMISALTLLRSDESPQGRAQWSYVALAEELRRVSARPEVDGIELFRRMVFNALISNSDDHPRNHALIAWKDSWRLSPAYDLTPTAPIALDRRDLALTIGDSGRYANAQNLLSQSRRFGLSHDDAATMLTQMAKHVTDRWQDACRRAGVTDRDCERIAGAFVYPGFWLSTP